MNRLTKALLFAALAAVTACGGSAAADSGHVTLRLGYQPNLTHATALVGVGQGYFRRALGGATLVTTPFNAGPDEVEALLSNSIDAAYLGPNPAVNAYVKSHGSAIRVVAGAAEGGAGLVVRSGLSTAAALKGKTLATPQLGNTQDVALRYWLKQQGLQTSTTGGGDVRIITEDNATTLTAFKAGQIDGAWVPEPWLSRLIVEGKGNLFVDERTLWPAGEFATTLLAVRTSFLQAHPDTVKALLRGQVDANTFLSSQPAAAQAATNDALSNLTGKKLSPAVLQSAWVRLTFTNDPVAATVQVAAAHAYTLGLLTSKPDLKGLFDLTLLNQVLAADHMSAVPAS
ncbi:MAG TPA: ABC transporter substrate-binding protein [Candidatus Dormibacteraeota bacterium]